MQEAERWIGGRWGASNLQLEWVAEPEMPTAARTLIDQLWAAECAKAASRGRVLFDGPVAVLAGWEQRGPNLGLRLYPGKYSDFQITCIRHPGSFHDEARRPALGSSVLLTHMGKAILGLRSQSSATYPGCLHLIGGTLTLNRGATGADALHELQREMHEELGLAPADMVTAPLVFGLLYEPNLHQPELVWTAPIRSGLSVDLAVNHEHSGLLRVTFAELTKGSLPNPVTPVARKALELLQV